MTCSTAVCISLRGAGLLGYERYFLKVDIRLQKQKKIKFLFFVIIIVSYSQNDIDFKFLPFWFSSLILWKSTEINEFKRVHPHLGSLVCLSFQAWRLKAVIPAVWMTAVSRLQPVSLHTDCSTAHSSLQNIFNVWFETPALARLGSMHIYPRPGQLSPLVSVCSNSHISLQHGAKRYAAEWGYLQYVFVAPQVYRLNENE